MEICFLSREYPPETHVGGIGTYTHNTALALARLGHTVHVVSSTQDEERTSQDEGVWVHRLKKRKIIPKELQYLYYSYSVARKISRMNCRFDIVQSSEFAHEAYWFALRKRFPLVTRLATPLYLSDKFDRRVFFRRRPLINLMEKEQTLKSDGIFTSTRALAKDVTERWGIETSRVAIIPNSVDVSRIIRLGTTEPPPEILKNEKFLLYFGRLQERKGVRVLAEALPEVLGRFPSLRMVFVGSDLGHRGASMRDYIMEKAGTCGTRILFLDNLPHEKLFPIVNLAHIVILPSLWEAFGFVCVEAMALGRPVIASSGSGFAEIIEDNVSGYLVEPGKSELLADKIIRSMQSPEDLDRISEGARRRARDFEVSQVALRLLEYYENVKRECLERKEGFTH